MQARTQSDAGESTRQRPRLFPGHGHHRRCHNQGFRFVQTNQPDLTVIGARGPG